MEELFNQLQLERVASLKRNDVLLVKKTNSTDTSNYCFKFHAGEQELKLYRDCFPKINQDDFHKLRLPKAVKIGSFFSNFGFWTLLEYYGNDIILWNETDPVHGGGKSISEDYVDILIDMVRDLKKIDISIFSHVLPFVDTCAWYTNLNQKAQNLTQRGLLSPTELQQVTEILSHGISVKQEDYIVTNGDFQFRNFVKQPDGKVVVIDWTENPFNTPNIEPIEFPIMYQWTLMWANPTWQNLYVKKAMEAFNISEARIRYALLVKSINQALLWPDTDLGKIQVEHCRRALNSEIISSHVVS